ncbi:MAG: hypothetical protein ACK53Y_00775, partial [bacterium]
MDNGQTDPQVGEAILSEFKHWRNTGHEQPSMLDTLALMQQGDIGWNLALEGWLATKWEVTQQSRYDLINSRKTGRCCLVLRWKKWTHNKCPRCGEFEDASHVISCKVPEATALWHSA